MTFLELVARTKQECGISGAAPATTIGQTKEIQRLCDWVSQSYTEIQLERDDFEFLRKSVVFNTSFGTAYGSGDALTVGCTYEIVTQSTTDFDTVGQLYSGTANSAGAIYMITSAVTLGAGDSVTLAGKQKYTVGNGVTYDINLTDFASWKNDSFRAYLKTAGIATQIVLSQYYRYTDFRDFYLLGSRQLVSGRPLYYTVAPDKSILLGFTPNDTYVVTGEYYRTPQILSADADVPLMPSRYHMAIVYKAMTKYGMFESAQEQVDAGKQNYSAMLNKLIIDQAPMVMGGASFI